jgi:hypothetical protein
MTFTELRFTCITGIIDAYDAVHSVHSSKSIPCHGEHWPFAKHGRWRWTFDKSIWCIGEDRLNSEQYLLVEQHITKKYGIRFWDNGHNDIDHFLAQLKAEKTQF